MLLTALHQELLPEKFIILIIFHNRLVRQRRFIRITTRSIQRILTIGTMEEDVVGVALILLVV